MRALLAFGLFLGPAWAQPAPFPGQASASAPASGLYFKPGKGLIAESGDGDFQLSIGARMQIRYTLAKDDDATEHQLHIRRLRLNMGGFLFGKDNTFKIQYAMSPNDLDERETVRHTPMLDAYAHFKQLRDVNVQIGQWKVPYSRERIASSGALSFVDRSLADGEFTVDRDTGMVLRSEDVAGADLLSYDVGVFTGEGKNGYTPEEAAPMLLARISLRPFGKFHEYDVPDLERVESPKLAIGGAFIHHVDARGSRGNRGFDVTREPSTFDHATADAIFKWSGWSILGAFYWRKGEDFTDGSNANGTGFFVESGLVFPRHPFDMAVRYGGTRPADDASSVAERSEMGVAFNHYIADHFLKMTLDYEHLWGDAGFDQGEDQVRVQMQMSL